MDSPPGPESPDQTINTSDAPLKYRSINSGALPEIYERRTSGESVRSRA